MILSEDIYSIYHSKSDDYQEFLTKYISQAHLLNYYEPSFIAEITKYCRQQIANYSYDNKLYYDKTNIAQSHKNASDLPYISTQSSGTTGPQFVYKLWKGAYFYIEKHCHYLHVASEYDIHDSGKLNILYLIFNRLSPEDPTIVTKRTDNIVLSHGFGKKAIVHQAMANSLFINNYLEYYRQIIECAIDQKIDIILADGGAAASLAAVSQKLAISSKIARLISCTNSKPDHSRLQYLKNNGLVDNWCDHMRCWDGGVTFMTCKYGTKHLLDGLSYSYNIDNKLISDDYFSLVFPFYKYWNGDYCDIGDKYLKCTCGRYYREFDIFRCRDRNTIVSQSNLYKAAMLIKDDLIRIENIGGLIRYYTKESVSNNTKQEIRKLLPNNIVVFILEQWINDIN